MIHHFPLYHISIKLEKYENNEDNVEVVFTIPVLPEINLGDYKSVKVEKEALDVNDEKVNAEIEIMRSNAGKLKEVADDEAAKDKDVANINFEGFIDGEAFDGGKAEGFDLTLGSKSFIDTFEDQIIGHKKGDEFDVNVTFPEEYHAESLKGKPAVFKVKVNSIKRKEEAELNEDLAKELGYDSCQQLKRRGYHLGSLFIFYLIFAPFLAISQSHFDRFFGFALAIISSNSVSIEMDTERAMFLFLKRGTLYSSKIAYTVCSDGTSAIFIISFMVCFCALYRRTTILHLSSDVFSISIVL